ncbi:heme A synthase [bacterium]|nr:MAG: heme A synthase [bacterium]
METQYRSSFAATSGVRSAVPRVVAFRWLAAFLVVCVYLLATLGSWVRINNDGMSCPTWPNCSANSLLTLHGFPFLESLHRLIAGPIVGPLTLVVLALAWINRRELPQAARAAWAVIGFLVLQIALGGVTIFASNDPPSVTAHWTVGMLLLGSIIAVAVLAWGPTAFEQSERRHAVAATPWLWLVALAALVTTAMGAYVSSSGFGLTCAGFPSCNGHWFGLAWPQGAQMTHRALAYAVLLTALLALVATLRGERGDLRAVALIAALLVVVQIGLGVANVLGRLPTPLREAHAANAALLYATYVVLLVRAAFLPQARAVRT